MSEYVLQLARRLKEVKKNKEEIHTNKIKEFINLYSCEIANDIYQRLEICVLNGDSKIKYSYDNIFIMLKRASIFVETHEAKNIMNIIMKNLFGTEDFSLDGLKYTWDEKEQNYIIYFPQNLLNNI